MKRKIVILFIVVAVIAAAVLIVLRIQADQAASTNNFQTEELKFGNLTALVGGTGTVRSNQTTQLAWQTSGRISKVTVKVGDKVTATQTLAELAESSLPQSVILARADLVTAKRNLDNLKQSGVAQSQAQLALAQAQKALKDAEDRKAEKAFNYIDPELITIARTNLVLANNEVQKAQDAYDRVKDRKDDDVIKATASQRLANAKQNRDQKQANLDYLLARPDPLDVNEIAAQVEVAKARLADAEREWKRLQNGPDALDISAAEARVSAIEATIAYAQLKAPFNGTITDAKSLAGDQVQPGTVSFRVDDLSTLLVDVQIPEVDINRIKVGQAARVSFDAIQGKEYNGKVKQVARIGVLGNGVVNFTVTIELTEIDDAVRPAMTSAVNMVVENLTNVLLVPNRAVRLRNGQRVVYLLQNNQAVPVVITIGATSDTFSQVLSGDIKAGDFVVLNPPVVFTAPSGGGMPFGR
jgi:HlyD family secretion protein